MKVTSLFIRPLPTALALAVAAASLPVASAAAVTRRTANAERPGSARTALVVATDFAPTAYHPGE